MFDENLETAFIIGIIFTIIIFSIILLASVKINFAEKEAIVKIQEVGKRYAFWNIGEQYYVIVQNEYSEQYASSSNAWDTCITEGQYDAFAEFKNSKQLVNIETKGYGISTAFTCLTGERIVSYKKVDR